MVHLTYSEMYVCFRELNFLNMKLIFLRKFPTGFKVEYLLKWLT